MIKVPDIGNQLPLDDDESEAKEKVKKKKAKKSKLRQTLIEEVESTPTPEVSKAKKAKTATETTPAKEETTPKGKQFSSTLSHKKKKSSSVRRGHFGEKHGVAGLHRHIAEIRQHACHPQAPAPCGGGGDDQSRICAQNLEKHPNPYDQRIRKL